MKFSALIWLGLLTNGAFSDMPTVYEFCSHVVATGDAGHGTPACDPNICQGRPGKVGPVGPTGSEGRRGAKGEKGYYDMTDHLKAKLQRLEDFFGEAALQMDNVCLMGIKSGRMPDSAMNASSEHSSMHGANSGRLDNWPDPGTVGAWCARENRAGEWIQVDFGAPVYLAGVITQGRPREGNQWVTSYKVVCGNTVEGLTFVRENGSEKVYTGNFDRDSKVYNKFISPLTCRYIRIYPQTYHSHISMRIEFVGGHCHDVYKMREFNCDLGMRSKKISDAAITASSEWDARHAARLGRLDNLPGSGTVGAWATRPNRVGQWIQVDFGSVIDVAGVITQGRHSSNQWVTSFKVSCGNILDGLEFVTENGRQRVFSGNSDADSKVYNRFHRSLRCRYIRIYPQGYHNHMSMRIEFIDARCFDFFSL